MKSQLCESIRVRRFLSIQLLLVIATHMIWATTPRAAHANFSGSDDFSAPSASWEADTSGGAGQYVLENGQLNFITTGAVTGNDTTQRDWIANFGSYSDDWSLRTDVAIADFPMIEGQDASMDMVVGNQNDFPNDFVRVVLRRDNTTSRSFYADAYANGLNLDAVFVPTSATIATIGLSYDSAAHIITAAYDANGPVNGYLFAPILPVAIDSGASDWNMDPTDVFFARLTGQTANLAVTVGQITADNFTASSEQLQFVPEPTAGLLGAAAVVIVVPLLRRRRSNRWAAMKTKSSSLISPVMQCVIGSVLVLTSNANMAQAIEVVDQSYVASGNVTSALAEGFAFVGQTATTGITGNLVAVELNASRRSDFLTPWILDIQRVVGGLPTGEVLSSTTIAPGDFFSGTLFAAPSVPLPLRADLSTPVFFQAGEPFGIILHPQGATGNPGLLAGQWAGGSLTDYAGGAAVAGLNSNALVAQDYDLHFRTLVSPVPEPAGIALLSMAGISLLVSSCSRRRVAIGCVQRIHS